MAGGKDNRKGTSGRRGGGKKSSQRTRKWELERRRRRMRQTLPLLLVGVGVVALIVGASVLAPPPSNGTGEGPCGGTRIPLKHYHAWLYIYQDGVLRNVPGDIGIDPTLTKDTSMAACTSGDPQHGVSPVHTHAGEANLVHVETIVDRTYTLGDFFRVWGKPLGPIQTWDMVADANHVLSMTVNGNPSSAWDGLVLQDQMQVRIDYNTV